MLKSIAFIMLVLYYTCAFFLCASQLVIARSIDPDATLKALSSRAFRIRSVVTTFVDFSYRHTFRIEENYSNEQKRGIIKYKLAKLRSDSERDEKKSTLAPMDEAGSLFSDSNLDAQFKYADGSQLCRMDSLNKGSASALDQLLRFDLIEARGQRDFVIGPTRWLEYVAKNLVPNEKNKEKLLSGEEIRNLPCVVYKLTREDRDMVVRVYYHQWSLGANHIDAIPLRVTILHEKKLTVIDFFEIEYLFGKLDMSSDRSDVLHDFFMLGPMSGCGQQVALKKQTINLSNIISNGADELNLNSMRYSFRGNVQLSTSSRSSSHSYTNDVAYDAFTGLMRVDLKDSTADVFQSRQVFNFHEKIQFYCLDNHHNNTFLVKALLKKQQNTQCLQLLIPDEQAKAQADLGSQGKLFVGSDQFVYLGKAIVRGIHTKVYEAPDTELPFWLEPSVVVSNFGKPDIWKATKSSSDKWISLLYMSESTKGNPAQMVLIELFRVDPSFKVSYEKRTVHVYDFMWRFEHRTAEGSPLDMFSLGQATVSEAWPEAIERAQVNMLLQSNSIERKTLNSYEKLSSMDRNLALMASLSRQLAVPINMVSNFKSKLIEDHSKDNDSGQLTLVVSFEFSSHIIERIDLEHIGSGRRVIGKSWYLSVISLSECVTLSAAQRGKTVYLGYEPRAAFCFIGIYEDPVPFDMDLSVNAAPLQVFRLTHKNVFATPSLLRKWFAVEGKHMDFKHLNDQFRNRALMLNNGAQSLDLGIRQFFVSDVKRKDVPTSFEGHWESADKLDETKERRVKLDGVTLVEQAKINEKLERVPLRPDFIDPLGKEHKTPVELREMSVDLCRSTCMGDIKCKSYSICFRFGQLECILSRVDFQSSEMQQKILDELKNATIAHRFNLQVTVDGDQNDAGQATSITLVKHPNCAIYIIRSIDFFTLFRVAGSQLVEQTALAVRDIEQCADWCAWYNFRAIRGHFSRIAQAMVDLGDKIFDNDASSKFHSLHPTSLVADNSKSICKQFRYIDESDLVTQDPGLRQRLLQSVESTFGSLGPDGDDSVRNFCLIPKDVISGQEQRGNKISNEQDSRLQVLDLRANGLFKMLSGRFKLETLYEEMHGVSLKQSNFDSDEQAALAMAQSYEPGMKLYSANKLIELVKRGENHQVLRKSGVEVCANRCLMLDGGPWPACKSFDIVVEFNNQNRSVTWCQLNSITLYQAISRNRNDLIETSIAGSDIVERRHYEPRPGYALELETFYSEREFFQFTQIKNSLLLHGAHTFRLILVLLVALGSGIYFGIMLGNRYWSLQTRSRGRMNSMSQMAVIDLPEQLDELEENNETQSKTTTSNNIKDILV